MQSTGDGFLTDAPEDPLFDLTIRGMRSSTFSFTLIEAVSGIIVRPLTPLRNTVPTLAHDTTRSIKRTLTLTLGVEDTAVFDSIAHRVVVAMVLEDGRSFPLGTYMPVSPSFLETTAGDLATIALTDEMFVLSQQISESFAVSTNSFAVSGGSPIVIAGNAFDAVNDFLDRYPLVTAPTTNIGNLQARRILKRDIEFSNFPIVNAWQTGTNGTTVLEDIATVGGYFTPWFDHNNVFRMIRTFDPADVVSTIDLDAQSNVLRDSIVRTDDLLNAPNRIIVVSNTGTGENRDRPLVGTFDIPANAPHSIDNRGFVAPETYTLQVDSAFQANTVAQNIALNQRTAERVELSTAPDPRHDSYDVIRWDGQLWLETAWSLPLAEGSAMSHTLQRIYR